MLDRAIPRVRVSVRNDAPLRPEGNFVLYWMTAARRTRRNFALDRALDLAREHGRPLLVLEALRCGSVYASDRMHRFVIDGMADNAARLAAAGVAYHPYVEPSAGAGRGLLRALAERAVVVVTDEYPGHFLPRMLDAAAAQCPLRLEAVDGNGLLPLRAADRVFVTAFSFRRFLQQALPGHLSDLPLEDPLTLAAGLPLAAVPADVAVRWPAASADLLAGRATLAALPIDHSVPVAPARGGAAEGERVLARFIDEWLLRYEGERNHPDADVTSGLSPYLHFGHVGAHQVFAAVTSFEHWSPSPVPRKVTGAREGWWGMRSAAEAFIDQVVTWRELGYVAAQHLPGNERYESIPEWARSTLDKHRGDPRAYTYDLARLEAAATHDRVWNAAQNQLVREGRIHNYLRMLWGKKVLEWSESPETAFAHLMHLNDKYALDGRDPNSVSGIAWCFGRYDRPWGPKRPVYGTVRYMSSDAAARKLRLTSYVRRLGT